MTHTLLTRSGLRALGVLFLVLPLAACGGKKTGVVTGKVTFKEKPLNAGSVVFYGEDGRVDSGNIDSDGSYRINRAPVGNVTVTVTVPPDVAARPPTKAPGDRARPHPGDKEKPPPSEVKAVQIPKKYSDKKSSGLLFTVTTGEQTIPIELKD